MHRCKHCGELLEGSRGMVFCSYKRGLVHHDCCVNDCSWHGAPCKHSRGVYFLDSMNAETKQ